MGLSSRETERLLSFSGRKPRGARHRQARGKGTHGSSPTLTFLCILGICFLVHGIHKFLNILGRLSHCSHGFPQLKGRKEKEDMKNIFFFAPNTMLACVFQRNPASEVHHSQVFPNSPESDSLRFWDYYRLCLKRKKKSGLKHLGEEKIHPS